MAYLVLMAEGQASHRFPIEKASLTIGRSPLCDIFLEDPSVSFEHARVNFSASGVEFDEVWLEDDKSTNGTFVNNKRIEKAQLRHNDTINIGLANFKYVDEQQAALESTVTIKKSWLPGILYLKDKE
ncbi:MAG: FHA domain-containing protein [Kangiellaceae bacterium]|jgi:pSer/pThr/pTyr-binding forkhead associated (FHA) protein|nr:FHA domain-containing protein [Kangiellaceae bacterium]